MVFLSFKSEVNLLTAFIILTSLNFASSLANSWITGNTDTNLHFEQEINEENYTPSFKGNKIEEESNKEDSTSKDFDDDILDDDNFEDNIPSFFENFKGGSKASTQTQYANNPIQTTKLALLENRIFSILLDFFNDFKYFAKDISEHQCHLDVLKFLAEYEQDRNLKIIGDSDNQADETEIAKSIAGNPVLAFRLIRRIFVTLLNKLFTSCLDDYFEVVESLENAFYQAEMMEPSQQDFNDALMGILRIQFVYGFNTSEIQQGKLFNASLSIEDCLLFANKAIELKAEIMAYQWLQTASELVTSLDFVKDEYIFMLDITWKQLQNLTHLQSVKHVHSQLSNKRQLSLGKMFEYSHYATCRGEGNFAKSTLNCMYLKPKVDSYFTLNRIKTEVLSQEPSLVLQFHDFVGDSLIDLVGTMITQQLIHETDNTKDDSTVEWNYITAANTLINTDTHPKLKDLTRRIEIFTGLKLVYDKVPSYMQATLYGALGGHYDFHHDGLPDKQHKITYSYGSQELSQVDGGYDNTATFMIFVSILVFSLKRKLLS